MVRRGLASISLKSCVRGCASVPEIANWPEKLGMSEYGPALCRKPHRHRCSWRTDGSGLRSVRRIARASLQKCRGQHASLVRSQSRLPRSARLPRRLLQNHPPMERVGGAPRLAGPQWCRCIPRSEGTHCQKLSLQPPAVNAPAQYQRRPRFRGISWRRHALRGGLHSRKIVQPEFFA